MNPAGFEVVHSLLATEHRKYYIEYGGGFCNHMAHGLITLYLLRASEQRLREWAEYYENHEVAGNHMEPQHERDETLTITRDNYQDFVGKKSNFMELYDFCRKEIESHGLEQTLQRIVPTVYRGIAGTILHPIIHLGFSVEIGDVPVAQAEGLAYLLFSNRPLTPFSVSERIQSGAPAEVLDAGTLIERIQQDKAMFNTFRSTTDTTGIANQLEYLSANGEGVLEYLFQWDALYLPSSTEEEKQRQFDEAAKSLAHAWTAVFCGTNPAARDFFLLHTVTGAFGAIKVAEKLPCHEQKMQLLAQFFFVAICFFVMAGCPEVHFHKKHTTKSWEELRHQLIAPGSQDNEVHVMKVVFVCERFEMMFGEDPLWRDTAAACLEVGVKEDQNKYIFRIGLKNQPDPRS